MKTIDLGVKTKKRTPTAENPEHEIEVTHHPEMSFVAPHELNLPKGHFQFHGRGRIVHHDARESGGAEGGNPRYTMEVHELTMPHDNGQGIGESDMQTTIAKMMDGLDSKGKGAEPVTPAGS